MDLPREVFPLLRAGGHAICRTAWSFGPTLEPAASNFVKLTEAVTAAPPSRRFTLVAILLVLDLRKPGKYPRHEHTQQEQKTWRRDQKRQVQNASDPVSLL